MDNPDQSRSPRGTPRPACHLAQSRGPYSSVLTIHQQRGRPVLVSFRLHPNSEGKAVAGLRVGLLHAFIGRLVHGPPSDLCISPFDILHNLAPPPAVSLSEASLERAHTISVRRSLLLTFGHEDQRQVRARAGARFHFPPPPPPSVSSPPGQVRLRLSAHCRSNKDIIQRLYGLSPRESTPPTAT